MLRLVPLVLLAACSAPLVDADTSEPRIYYVAPSGDDGATGLDAPNAFRTLSHAVDVLEPGDTLFILPGTYTEQIVIEGFGHADRATKIMGINGLPVLSGGGATAPGIACWGCRNVEITCLELRDFDGPGITVAGSETVTLRDIVISDVSGTGVEVSSSDDIVVEWLELARIGESAIVVRDVHGIRVANNRASGVGAEPYVFDDTNVDAERNEVVGG